MEASSTTSDNPNTRIPAPDRTSPSSMKLTSEDVATYVNDPRFHRMFQLSADPTRGRPEPLQISYADYGYQHQNITGSNRQQNDEERILLFFGPLMSSPLFGIARDALAKQYKVRIIHPSRPGIGKTTPVPADKLLATWREATADLLRHLSIRHVTIAAHSAGTLFGLDFALHYPEFLEPRKPYIAIAGPWVHPSHSGMPLWSFASSWLPSSLVAQTGKMASFVNSSPLRGLTGVSAAVSGSVLKLGSSENIAKGRIGADVELEDALRDGVVEYIFTKSNGSVDGLGQEAQLLIRNGVEEGGWADWSDYDMLAPRLAEKVGELTEARQKLRVDVFFSEKDNMIGNAGSKGPKWMDECWRSLEGVEYRSETVTGAEHDGVWELRWDVLEKVLRTMTGVSSP